VIERISRGIDDLDATMAEIRAAIFELGESALPGGLRQAVHQLAEELAPTLGSRAEVSFKGAVDNAIPQHIGDHVLAVVREGLTNAGKHSGATQFVVEIGVDDDELVVEVTDNGRGIELPLSQPGLGLANMRDRADKLGGSFEVLPAVSGGTCLVWRVPL
jgi:signal transduction histidine kinase